MQKQPGRTLLSAPTLIRHLARFNDIDVAAPMQSLSDSLSQWLGWTDAIALSGALKAGAPSVPTPVSLKEDFHPLIAREQAEFDRVLASMRRSIDVIGSPPAQTRAGGQVRHPPPPRALDVDVAIHRQRYVGAQHSMALALSHLRTRLRTTLASVSPDMNRLAIMDGLMEKVLDARQQSLLARIPALLETHFQRLQLQEDAAPKAHEQATRAASAAPDRPAVVKGAWLDCFKKDMQGVLRAELDIRIHPAQGLMAALRAC